MPPWLNSAWGIRCTRAPAASAASAVPSPEPESTTTSSKPPGIVWRPRIARSSRKRAPPFQVGITTETRAGPGRIAPRGSPAGTAVDVMEARGLSP